MPKKIAIVFPKSSTAAWSLCDGLVNTVKRMGFEAMVINPPVGGGDIPRHIFDMVRAEQPDITEIKKCDAVIVSGPEHVGPWLDNLYGKYGWKNLGIPRAAWYHESFHRDDYSIDFEGVKYWADHHFVPAIQDADFLDQESFAAGKVSYLPFGVDTEMFLDEVAFVDIPTASKQAIRARRWPVGFVGLLYERRVKYLNALSNHDHPAIRIGQCSHVDMDGWNASKSSEILSAAYNDIEVFFNLPSMSRLLVSKVFEVMACGTFLMTPMLGGEAGADKNQELFENGKHLVYYRSGNLPRVANLLKEWSSDEKRDERIQIAEAGRVEVVTKHNLETRVDTILRTLGVERTIQ